MSLLSAKEIMEIIPHRQPFMLLDTIEELTPGSRAVAKNVLPTMSLTFRGIFRGNRLCRAY